MRIRMFLTAFLTLALFTTGYAQPVDTARLDQFFDRLAEKKQAMGSLTIAKDGEVIYSRAIGYGQINGAEKKALTAGSRFRIASIGKLYTSVMIMQLVEEQKLKLTDTLDKFFPQFPNANKITVHRSGLPRGGYFSFARVLSRPARIRCRFHLRECPWRINLDQASR